jgi:hypothetical protein
LNKLQVLGFWRCRELQEISAIKSLPSIRRINFYECDKVEGGDFFLEMLPTALTKISAAPNKLKRTPLGPFLNFKGTRVKPQLLIELRKKYPGLEVR